MFNDGQDSSGSGYKITNSLRFRSSASAYLSRTPASAGNRKTWTWSGWVKRGQLGRIQHIFHAQNSVNNRFALAFDSSDTLYAANPNPGTMNYATNAVFRDISAHYHIVCAVDTNLSTSGDRCKLYVNGVRLTTTGTDFTSGLDTWVNGTIAHYIGRDPEVPGSRDVDGYISEVNFIDGQALGPSYFGVTNSDGVWIPKAYTGTYGTNGFYLKFNDGTNLTNLCLDRSGNSNHWTASGVSLTGVTTDWMVDTPSVNYAVLSPIDQNATTIADGNLRMTAGNANTNNVYGSMRFPVSGKFYYEFKNSNGSDANNGLWFGLTTDGVAPSTAVNSASRCVLYASSGANLWINGGSVGVTGLSAFSSTHTYLVAVDMDNLKAWVGYYNGTSTIWFNSAGGTTGDPATGANPTFTLSSAYTYAPICGMQGTGGWFQYANFGQRGFDRTPPTGFGALNTSRLPAVGITSPSTNFYTTTYTGDGTQGGSPGGRNGAGSGSGGEGGGSSGIYRNGTALILGAGGAGGGGGSAAGNGGAGGAGGAGAGTGGAPGTGGISGGTSTNGGGGGGGGGSDAGGSANGGAGGSNVVSGTNTTSTNGSGTAVANSADANYVSSHGNGGATSSTGTSSVNNGQDGIVWIQYPASGGTTATYSTSGTTYFKVPTGVTSIRVKAWGAGASSGFGGTSTLGGAGGGGGFAQGDITVTPGEFLTITVGSGGNLITSSPQNIYAPFQPDLVWVKSRGAASSHRIVDAVRGATEVLYSDLANAGTTEATALTAFNANGFSVGNGSMNVVNTTMVGWQWKGGNGTVTNTAGSITSTVSANVSAGFSIVTYTGNSSTGQTIGHGLGVAPKMIIVKRRDGASDWPVWHSGLTPTTGTLYLDLTSAQTAFPNRFDSTGMTSAVFKTGSLAVPNEVNASGGTFVAYCFAEVPGFSKIGSYTGNGSADGPFVFCGFRPRWVLIKRTDVAANWNLYDTARSQFNASTLWLNPNLSDAELTTAAALDILSNGFKARDAGGSATNASGGTYIYIAFAENPFGGSNVAPSTAR